MHGIESIPEVPDLSGEVAITGVRPVFTGPYSCVYRGKLRRDGQMVAIKVLNGMDGAALHTMQRKLKRERRTWGILNHPNILPLYGFADDEEAFQPFGALISPWREHGDASKYLAENGKWMSVDDRVGLWRDVIQGVNYLHSHRPCLIHGDLKPRNILIDDSGHAQICDFGLVRIFLDEGSSGMTTTTHYTGTERYLAYELVVAEEEPTPTTATDIHAVGCIGLEFIFSQIPYSSRKNNYGGSVYLDIRSGKPPAVCPPDLSPPLAPIWKFVEPCWNLNPHNRPPAALLLAWLVEMAQVETWEHAWNYERDKIVRNTSPEQINISATSQESSPRDTTINAQIKSPPNITPQGEQSEGLGPGLAEYDLETALNTSRNSVLPPFEDAAFDASDALDAVSTAATTASDATSTTAVVGTRGRMVHWDTNLVTDIPDQPANPRTKGWFNRRGDQLWCNDGRFKRAANEYPVHLRNYPEVGFWMNHLGVVIDVTHRRIPLQASKGILKQGGLL